MLNVSTTVYSNCSIWTVTVTFVLFVGIQ